MKYCETKPPWHLQENINFNRLKKHNIIIQNESFDEERPVLCVSKGSLNFYKLSPSDGNPANGETTAALK